VGGVSEQFCTLVLLSISNARKDSLTSLSSRVMLTVTVFISQQWAAGLTGNRKLAALFYPKNCSKAGLSQSRTAPAGYSLKFKHFEA